MSSSMQYVAVIATALIAIYTLCRHYRNKETQRVERPIIVLLIFLCASGAIYSTYATYRDSGYLDAWKSTREVHERLIALYAEFKVAQGTNDVAAIQKTINDATALALYAEQKKAPLATRERASLFSIAIMLWAMSKLYPDKSVADLVTQVMAQSPSGSRGMLAGPALMKLNFFRAQDFGPPYFVLRGFDASGSPLLNSVRFNSAFLETRIYDLMQDSMAATQ